MPTTIRQVPAAYREWTPRQRRNYDQFGFVPRGTDLPTPTGAATPAPGAGPTLPGAAPVGGYGAYGGVPQVPNPQLTQTDVLKGNVGALPNITSLAQALDTFSTRQAVAPYIANLPNYSAMTGQASQNILSNLQGQVAQDVWTQLQQRAAERGVSIGSPGSPNAETALLRALGLTSLDLQNQGQQQFSQAMARTPVPQLFNPASMLLTPDVQQGWAYLANVLAAAPDPAARAAADLASMLRGVSAGGGGQGSPIAGYGRAPIPLPGMPSTGPGSMTGAMPAAMSNQPVAPKAPMGSVAANPQFPFSMIPTGVPGTGFVPMPNLGSGAASGGAVWPYGDRGNSAPGYASPYSDVMSSTPYNSDLWSQWEDEMFG